MSLEGIHQLFMSKANQKYLSNEFARLSKKNGGKKTLEYWQAEVPKLMAQKKFYPQDGEEIHQDPLDELKKVDNQFLQDNVAIWKVIDKPDLKEWTYDDYVNADLPYAQEVWTDNSNYRNDNKPYLLQQKMHSRYVDDDGRIRARDLEQPTSGYDMSAVYERVDAEYPNILDAQPSYDADGDSDTLLTATH